MQVRQTGLSHPRFFLAIILLSSSAVAAFGQSSVTSQENAGKADFAAVAKSATAAREAGRADEAIREYRRAVKISPS
jgi:uncharacterized protein (UPF0333 family)